MAVYTTIDDPSAYFKVQLFTGTGSSNAVTFNDTDTDMQPDLVWIKSRDDTNEHYISDSVRGTGKEIYSSLSNAEVSDANGVTAFGSDGFTVGSGTGLNGSSDSNVAWCWKESATAGFDIVSFTPSGSGDATVSHSLGVEPKMVITKGRESSSPWNTYNKNLHASAPEDYYVALNSTNASSSDSPGVFGAGMTSSNIGIGVGVGFTSGEDYIAYAFAEKQGFSKFGKYTGNGNAAGTYIYLGFRPAFFMTKKSSASGNNWTIWDNKRDPDNPMDLLLHPNSSNAENDSGDDIQFFSNGIRLNNTSGGNNADGATYIFMAFAEAPTVNSKGVPCNAR